MSRSRKPDRVPAAVVRQVLQRAPANPLSRLVEAQQFLATGQVDAAEALLRPALENANLRPEAQYLLGIAALMAGQPQAGLRQAKEAVRLSPDEPRYQFALGRMHKACLDLDAAEAAYRRALALDPDYADAHVSLGIVLKAKGDLDAAIDHHERAIALNPRLAAAHANLANARATRAEREAEVPVDSEPSEALLQATVQALALDPTNAVLHRNHGLLLLRGHRRAEATEAFNRALGLDPKDVEACLHLGGCLKAAGLTQHAVKLYEQWLGINAPNAAVMRSLASLLTRDGHADAGLGWAERAAAIDDDPWALLQLCNAYQQCRRLEESVAIGRRALALSGGRREFYPMLLLSLLYLQDDPQPIFEASAALGRELARAAQPRPPRRPREPGARLKVGYVSGDFVLHSVAYFIAGLLEHHDRGRFEIHCYHNRGWGDAVTERFKALGHHWTECEGLSDEQLRRRIIDDGIDILIDLAGHTAHSRVFMLALGAAPVQIAYLGYPTVSGVQAIDFRITDAVIDPGDMPPLASERPLALPRTMFCYRPDASPAIEPPPVQRAGHITLGSFNNIAKLSDHTLRLWAQVLHAVPGSRLLLKSASMAEASNRDSITRFMLAHGIGTERIELLARISSKTSHLELYNRLDIALDSFPYNGATTTCEALWMGVPVVTRRGRTHTSRMGASILAAIGRTDWVADDDAAYVATVARLAGDVEGLAHWRADARASLRASPLFDERGFTRSFEAALEEAWAAAGEPAADLITK